MTASHSKSRDYTCRLKFSAGKRKQQNKTNEMLRSLVDGHASFPLLPSTSISNVTLSSIVKFEVIFGRFNLSILVI